ncbi:MAG: hypothetical protein BM556_04390 [Bacteriovorax sp. MedPE-SWde]|nr:MAG: hypothetical protein BM556_04390 [Bacteriovorax sp. MedPE-SWde]
MSKLGVGKEIVTNCSKCKLELAHLIVAMKDELTPHKVQCKTCKSTHTFKTKKAPAAKKKTTRKPRVSAADKITNAWEAGMSKQDGDLTKYSPKTKFEIGELIDHPTFGSGVVDKQIDNNKIQVIFKTDIKVLIHNK